MQLVMIPNRLFTGMSTVQRTGIRLVNAGRNTLEHRPHIRSGVGNRPPRLYSTTGRSQTQSRVAVLCQAIDPPVINGVRKPMKPGGYQDSGADIAFSLQSQPGVDVLTPYSSPSPKDPTRWCFPDTEEGILSALKQGATHLWANTILFASHPLQQSELVGKYQDAIRVVGQPPNLVEQFDDKEYVNNFLRSRQNFTLPRGWTVHMSDDFQAALIGMNLLFPVVGKPVRGRGSYGVKVCHTQSELVDHVATLFEDSSSVMIEEYLSGEEATVTIMPPSHANQDYWAMPIVTRFNHEGGIAPYNGVVAVTTNSRVVLEKEYAEDPRYFEAARECEAVARLLKLTAPIRVDIRRFTKDPASKFALFDVNMKPNMTGPGRPGRENQASLTALSAAGFGWDYPRLLKEMLASSFNLRHLRNMKPDTK